MFPGGGLAGDLDGAEMSHTEMDSSAEIHLMLTAGIDSNAEMNSILNGEMNWNGNG